MSIQKVDGIDFTSGDEKSGVLSTFLGFNPKSRFIACAETDEKIHITATMAKPEEWVALFAAISRARAYEGKELVFHGFDSSQEWRIAGRADFEQIDFIRSFDSYSDLKVTDDGELVKN